MRSSFIKHQKRRSIHHQWSVGSTRCLAVAGHAQSEWNLYLRWRNASPPLDLNRSTLHSGWLVRRWNIYIYSVTFSYKCRKSFIFRLDVWTMFCYWSLCISRWSLTIWIGTWIDMTRSSATAKSTARHSPHFFRHFTHWHFPAARNAKPAFYKCFYFRNSAELAYCFLMVSDDRYEPIIVAKDSTVKFLPLIRDSNSWFMTMCAL